MISIIYLAYSCYRLIRRRWCKLPFLPAIFQKKKDVLYAKVPIKVPFHLPTSWHFRGSLAFVMVIVWEKNAAKNPPLPFPHYLVLLLVVGLILIGRFVDNLRCEKIGLILPGFIQRKGFKFQLLFDYSYLYISAFLLPTSLILTTLAVADAGNNLKSITLCCYAKFCPNKSTIFSSYFLTVVQQIIVYVNLGTRCLNHLLYF